MILQIIKRNFHFKLLFLLKIIFLKFKNYPLYIILKNLIKKSSKTL